MHSVMVSRSDDRPFHDRDETAGGVPTPLALLFDRHAGDPPARIATTWGRSVCGLHTLKGAVAPLTIQATLWDT